MDIAVGGFGTKRSEGKLSLQRFCKLRYFGKIRAARRDGISKAVLIQMKSSDAFLTGGQPSCECLLQRRCNIGAAIAGAAIVVPFVLSQKMTI